jgi:tetratricopeptide (TPR) repeat protein
MASFQSASSALRLRPPGFSRVTTEDISQFVRVRGARQHNLKDISVLHSAAIPYWQRASKLSPVDSPIHLSLALELMEAGRNPEAITELRAIVPQSAVVLTNLGAALARANRLEDAVAMYRKAIQSD